MSQFLQSAPVPVGATKPIQPGGVLSYSNNTKPGGFANAKVQSTYGFKIYNTAPGFLGERSGHYSCVVDQPDDKRMGAPAMDDVFTPADAEMNELTKYFLKRLPTEQKSLQAVRTIKEYGVTELLSKYLRKKLQDDAEEVKARYAGATAVERELASARLQNRFSDMIRYYGSEQRLREALLRDVVAGEPEVALRSALSAGIRREMAVGGAGAFPVDADAPANAMPYGGMEAGAEEADADEILGEAVMEREADSLEIPPASMGSGELEQINREIADLNEELEELESMDDIEDAPEADVVEGRIAEILAQLEELANRRRAIRDEMARANPEDRASASMMVEAGGGADGDLGSTSYVGVRDDMDAGYAPGGGADSMYEELPVTGGGGVLASRELPLPRAPAGSTGRPLIGEMIGMEAAAAPAAAMASQDEAAAMATARQDMFTRRGGRRASLRSALERQIMGMTMDDEEEAVSTHRQEVTGTDRREMEGLRPAEAPRVRQPRSDKGQTRGPRGIGRKRR